MEKPRWERRQDHVEALIAAALEAVDPAAAVGRYLSINDEGIQAGEKIYPLKADSRVFVVGAGKAGVAMARAAAGILGKRLYRCVMAVPDPPPDDHRVEWIKAGHPLPTAGSVEAGRRMQELLIETRPRDLVLALISGGGSALLELPVEGISLADLRATTDALLRSGAMIHEINAVRHQLSQIKGGGLARMAAPSPVVTLLLSDVVGDLLNVIASGPTVPATFDPAEVHTIIDRYYLSAQLPESVRARLSKAEEQQIKDFPRTDHVIVANNRTAAGAAARRAGQLGFRISVLTTYLEGEARQVGRVLASLAKSIRQHGEPLAPPACLVLGGETTVHVRGAGRGGRNQEVAVAGALGFAGWERCLLATLATDGTDGPTPAAGAIVTGATALEAAAKGLDLSASLANNDTYPALSSMGLTVETGPTGTNVNDLAFVLVY